MQGIELEPRINPVGHAQGGVKGRLAGLFDRQGIQGVALALIGSLSEEISKHEQQPLFRRAVALGRSAG
ncbi:hypothetical protein D3C81_1659710 [compost metagenome]